MLFFSFICKIGYDYFKTHNNGLYYTYETLTILLIVCFFICLVLTFMLEHGLYKNVKKVELATKKNLDKLFAVIIFGEISVIEKLQRERKFLLGL